MSKQSSRITNKEKHILFGTWNVRTLYKAGRIENINREMSRMGINILGLCETRHTGTGNFVLENHKIIYSGGSEHKRGVGIILDELSAKTVKGYYAISDRVLLIKLKSTPLDTNFIQVYAPTADSTEESIDRFYDEINEAMKQCKSQEVTIIMGDINAKVGMGKTDNLVGMFGLGERNERGDGLVE